jgi:hypothetical protein
MDPEEVKRLLEVLRDRLTADGVDAQVHVIGGSAMALLFPDDIETRFTTDIDAAINPLPPVRRVIEQIADELGLSPTWLNANGGPFIPPRDDLPNNSAGVLITIATARELIAMKLAAARHQDIFDLGILARHEGITDPEELVQIAFEQYGDDSMVLTEPRAEYLLLARDALDAERRRSKRRRSSGPGRE